MATTYYPSVKMVNLAAAADVAFVGVWTKIRKIRWNAPTTADHQCVMQDCPSGTTGVETWWRRNCPSTGVKADIEENFKDQWIQGIKLLTLGSGSVDVYYS
jgi:cobalamin biosynthesis protein CbiG